MDRQPEQTTPRARATYMHSKATSLVFVIACARLVDVAQAGYSPKFGKGMIKNTHFFVGDELGKPGHDPVDLEWSADFVDGKVIPTAVATKIKQEGYSASEAAAGIIKKGKDMIAFHNQDNTFMSDSGAEVKIPVTEMLRSGGFPMCPNYWDDKWGLLDEFPAGEATMEPDYLNRKEHACNASKPDKYCRAVSHYKYPSAGAGSPFTGDPELSFCRRVQYDNDASCCIKMHDDDIQEEFEELTGGGYLPGHVFLQQYMCLPCHPMISCLIDESTQTLNIPLEYAKKLAAAMPDFDRTGLKIKMGEFGAGQDLHPDAEDTGNLGEGPLRQDELAIPTQWYGEDNECVCVSVTDCDCIVQFLTWTRPPGVNDYDGISMIIQIVDGDPCGVLKDLVPGLKEPAKDSGAVRVGVGAAAWLLVTTAWWLATSL